jgi:hypothetical protein
VKEGKRPPIPDSCIPSYRQLIEQCWAQDPSTPNRTRSDTTRTRTTAHTSPHTHAKIRFTDQRPSCKEIVERIEGIIRGVCPEIARYDASAETDFKARRSAEAARRQQREQRLDSTKKEKYGTYDTHTTRVRHNSLRVCVCVCVIECEQCRWSAFGR